jgi:hypothetical protein
MAYEYGLWLGGILLLMSCLGLVCTVRSGSWGTIQCDLKDSTLVLENSVLYCRWGNKTFGDGAKNHVILELRDKRNNTNHAGDQLDGVWMAYAKGRGPLTKAEVVYDGKERKTGHLEWNRGTVVQEISIFPDSPVLKIDYLVYGVNVVDIGKPGGKPKGTYVFHGADQWYKTRKTITDTAFRNHPNEHHRLVDDLYPNYPNPVFLREWGGQDLNYHGWFIMGVYDDSTGAGFGRVMPFKHIDIIKLLWQKGFELFPHFGNPHQSFSGYLFTVTGGKQEILRRGRQIADSAGARTSGV